MHKLRNMGVLDDNDLRQLGATPRGVGLPVAGGELSSQDLHAQLYWMESQGRLTP
jgi:hypothetical protein